MNPLTRNPFPNPLPLPKNPLTAKKQTRLLHSHTLCQVSWEVNVEVFCDGEPVGDELQRNDVEDALQAVDRLGDLDLFAVLVLKLFVALVANDNRAASTCNDYNSVSGNVQSGKKDEIYKPCW